MGRFNGRTREPIKNEKAFAVRVFSVQHSKTAYLADFGVYFVAVAALVALLLIKGPRSQQLEAIVFVATGLLCWTGIEYVLHRFVLHGLQPFRRWHMKHHERPTALICAPTVLSAALIASMVFLPALLVGGLWRAVELTLGVLTGYVIYGALHHATHHWRANTTYLKERKRRHCLHHHKVERPGNFGVTTSLWDRVFGTSI